MFVLRKSNFNQNSVSACLEESLFLFLTDSDQTKTPVFQEHIRLRCGDTELDADVRDKLSSRALRSLCLQVKAFFWVIESVDILGDFSSEHAIGG